MFAGAGFPISRSHEFGNLTPFGASDFTPHAAGCIVHVKRTPSMQFFTQMTTNPDPFLLEQVYALGIRPYPIEIIETHMERMLIEIRWE